MRISSTLFLFLLVVVFCLLVQQTHASSISSFTPEPAQYSLRKLIGLHNGDGKPKLQVGFNQINSLSMASATGEMVVSEMDALKKFSLDSQEALVSVISLPGLSFQIFVSNSDASEFFFFDSPFIKRWKAGVINVIAGNGNLVNGYYLNESNATQTFLNNPKGLFLQQDCLYISGYGIAKLNLTNGMISTVFQIGTVKDMSISKDGYMYFTIGQELRRCELSSNCSSQQLLAPSCDAFTLVEDSNYELYYQNFTQINLYNLTTGISRSIIQSVIPNRMKLAYRNNMLYFIDNLKIKKINLTDLLYSVSVEAGNGYYSYSQDNIPYQQNGLRGTSQSIVLRNEELYYTDWYTIKKIDRNGIVRRVAGTGTFSTLSNEKESIALQTDVIPSSLSFSKKGELHFVDSNYIVRKVSDNGNVSYVGGNPLSFVSEGNATMAIIYPKKIIQLGNELIICESQRIRKVSSEGIISTIVGGGNYPFQEGALATNTSFRMMDIAISPIDDTLYFVDDEFIRKLASNGSVYTVWKSPFNRIDSIGIDQSGFFYFTTSDRYFVKLNPETTTAQYFSNKLSPYMLTVSNSGDVYILYDYDCTIMLNRNGFLSVVVGAEVCGSSIFDSMNATQPVPLIYTIHYSNIENQLYFSTTNGIWKLVDGLIRKVYQLEGQSNNPRIAPSLLECLYHYLLKKMEM